MLLRRFAYPCRYSDTVPCFGRLVPILGMANNKVLDYIYGTCRHLLTDWNPHLLIAQALEEYAQSISNVFQGKDHHYKIALVLWVIITAA